MKIWFQNRRAKERKQNKKRVQSQGSEQQEELDEEEKDLEETSPSSSPAGIKQEHHQQQQHTTDGDFIIGSACAQSMKSDLVVDSYLVPSSKNDELLNALRNGSQSSSPMTS